MSANSTMDLADRLLAEGRARRHRERTELAKLITAEEAGQQALVAKFAEFDARIDEIKKLLLANEKLMGVLEKQMSSAAVQPSRPELSSWSPERLAAVIAALPSAEREKLFKS
jgi:hypothetical protein